MPSRVFLRLSALAFVVIFAVTAIGLTTHAQMCGSGGGCSSPGAGYCANSYPNTCLALGGFGCINNGTVCGTKYASIDYNFSGIQEHWYTCNTGSGGQSCNYTMTTCANVDVYSQAGCDIDYYMNEYTVRICSVNLSNSDCCTPGNCPGG